MLLFPSVPAVAGRLAAIRVVSVVVTVIPLTG